MLLTKNNLCSSEDQTLSFDSIDANAKIWMKSLQDFFKKVVIDCNEKVLHNCDIQDPQGHQGEISAGLVELTDMNVTHLHIIPLCKVHIGSDYALGGIKGAMKTIQATNAFKVPIKSQNWPTRKILDTLEHSDGKVVFTQKDFEPTTFLGKQCLLTIPLTTYGIGTTSMEYKWKAAGKFLQLLKLQNLVMKKNIMKHLLRY